MLILAVAAGVARPRLDRFCYLPGGHDPQALRALTVAYCVLPCLLTLLAASLLYVLIIRRPLGGIPRKPVTAKVLP